MEESIFTKIIRGEIPADKIYEDDETMAIMDINPSNPGHSLVIPKKEYRNILETPDEIIGKLMAAAKKIGKASMEALEADGFNIIINTAPEAGQIVFHTHLHIIPRFSGDGLRHWQKRPYKRDGEAKEIAEKIKAKIGKNKNPANT